MLHNIALMHPSRGRPTQARHAFEKWQDTATCSLRLNHVLSLDSDDPKKYRYRKEFADTGTEIVVSDNATMVDALNRCLPVVTDGMAITLYDDMTPCDEWDTLLDEAYQPGKLIQVTDPLNPNLQTVCCGCASVFRNWGYVYYPGYISMFADNDYQEHGQQDGLFVPSKMTIDHKHPAHGKAKTDTTYERQNHGAAYRLGNIVLAGRRVRRFAW